LFVLQVGERVRVTAVPARRTIRYNWKAMVQARHGSLKPAPPPTRNGTRNGTRNSTTLE
jgi:hypothetical protein